MNGTRSQVSWFTRRWVLVMAPLGVYGILAPYISRAVGLPVPVPARLEIVDHLVPGVVVLGVVAVTAAQRRLTLVGTLLATLAGFWMTATHVPLLLQAQQGEVDWKPALIHSLGGIALLGLAVAGAVVAWREAT